MNDARMSLTLFTILSLGVLAGFGLDQEADDDLKKTVADQQKRIKLLEDNLLKHYEETKRANKQAAEQREKAIEKAEALVENTTNALVQLDAVEDAVKNTNGSLKRRLEVLTLRTEDVVAAIGDPTERLGGIVTDQGLNYVLLRNGAVARITNGKVSGYR